MSAVLTTMLAPALSAPPTVMVWLYPRKRSRLVLPVILGEPDRVMVMALPNAAYTPPTPRAEVLPVMVPPVMVKVPSLMYTPPP